ncbi:MAG: DUF3990 domain-containing protein [bacterium]|nr:DUF3990 domain-containing protein [Candidatus Minthenecus merdequi]
MELYHGSSIAVTTPQSHAGRRNLDFGRGFYATRIKSQAQKWAFLVASRKAKNAQSFVSVYEFNETEMLNGKYVYKNFPAYNIEWLEFVVACRQGKDNTNYDIVEGGVANDQVIDTVEDYENGRITAGQALDQLKYKKPNNQVCFRNQEIIDKYLRFVGTGIVNPQDIKL